MSDHKISSVNCDHLLSSKISPVKTQWFCCLCGTTEFHEPQDSNNGIGKFVEFPIGKNDNNRTNLRFSARAAIFSSVLGRFHFSHH